MAFGSPAVATWGNSQWGTVLPEVGRVFTVDSVAQGVDLEQIFLVDNLGALVDEDRTWAVDSLGLGTPDRQFSVDVLPAPFPSSVLSQLQVAPYLLVFLDLPGGEVRVSEKCRVALSAAWDGRLVRGDDLLRTIGAGTDDAVLVLDDTDTDGQARFRDLFVANDPEGSVVRIWLGAEGLTAGQHLKVFEGSVSEVQAFDYTTVRLRILRREAVEDKLLGQLVDLTNFPFAPPESVGRMLPQVMGNVRASEGVVIDTLALGKLSRFLGLAETVVPLVDASSFPITGTVLVDQEQILYTGKAANELLVTARGVGGTTPANHSEDTEVNELGNFQVQFAQHACAQIQNVKIELPTGNLGDPVPQPTSVNVLTAVATWATLPQIRDPDARPIFQRIHFDQPGAGNTASNPQFAARENIGYEAFKVAGVNLGQQLRLLTKTDGLGQPGDIEAVWLGVLFDPASVGGRVASASVRVGGASGKDYFLESTDVVPDEIARHDEKTGDRIYDVPPPVITTPKPSPQPFTITPSVVIHPGIFGFRTNAQRVVDKDLATCASYMFIGIGEAAIVGSADAVFKTPAGVTTPQQNGQTPTSAQIVFVAGWDLTPFTSHFDVWLQDQNGEIPGTRFKACTAGPSVPCVGLISGKERFEKTIDVALLDRLDEISWVVHPALGVSNGLWVGCELFIEGLADPQPPQQTVTQDTRGSVTNYFDVTDLLPVGPGIGGPTKDWSWFGDPATGGEAVFTTTFVAPGDVLRVIETFYVVRYRPFSQAGSQVPRVFADVLGLIPNGNPVDMARLLVTSAPPLGLGLPGTRIDQASYVATDASLQGDQVVAGFALREPVSAVDLLSQLAIETDCQDTWNDDGQHRLIRRPRADTPLPVVRTITDCDLLTSQGGRAISFKRSAVDRLTNEFEVRWRLYSPSGEFSRSDTVANGASQGNPRFGVRATVLELALIEDDATALLVATRKAERMGFPRWVGDLELTLDSLQLQKGDLVALATREFTFAVCEVVEVTLGTAGFRRAKVSLVVWDVT